MRKKGWTYYLLQGCCWLLVLQLLNISIDPPNDTLHHDASCKHRQQTNINQIESICELIAEEMAHTVVPDNQDPDIEKNTNPVFLYCSSPIVQSFVFSPPLLEHESYYTARFTFRRNEPLVQPPKSS
jgi:hypothetical protein